MKSCLSILCEAGSSFVASFLKKQFLRGLIAVSFIGFCNLDATAQCAPPAPCIPSPALTPNLVFGCGISQFSIDTFTRQSGLAINGFEDFSCDTAIVLRIGTAYTLSVVNGQNAPENVRVWLDMNRDGSFNPVTELIFSSNNALSHTGTIVLPGQVYTDSVLRLRVLSEISGAPDAPLSGLAPCYSPKYSQVEDYAVIAVPPVDPPNAAFTSNDTITCSGTIQFYDQSLNAPNSWHWDFGDGNTSILQNPVHTYLPGGPFTVKLRVSNANGVDSLTRVNFIRVSNQIPIAASCTPITNAYCCNYGITKFKLGNIEKISGIGSEGYKDFTCGQFHTFTLGIPEQIEVLTGGSLPHDVKVWIDLNNDGSFASNELVWSRINTTNPNGSITISDTGVVKNTPLRLRIIADFTGSLFTACNNIQHGQAEDYTVIIEPNQMMPMARFSVNQRSNCSGTFNFSNRSENLVTSYLWDFGDGDTSINEHPSHTYTTPGIYTVKLKVTGPSGMDSTVYREYIHYTSPLDTGTCSYIYGISTVFEYFRFGGLHVNRKPPSFIGYQDLTCEQIAIANVGSYLPFYVHRTSDYTIKFRIWLDINNDGQFDSTEILKDQSSSSVQNELQVYIPEYVVRDTVLRLRFGMSINSEIYSFDPCGLQIDYNMVYDIGVLIPSSTTPVARFHTFDTAVCNGYVQFWNLSTGRNLQYTWYFGDGDSSNLESPLKAYANSGVYSIKLKACDSTQCTETEVRNYISVNVDPTAPRPTTTICNNSNFISTVKAIDTLVFGNIHFTPNHSSGSSTDMTCSLVVYENSDSSINFRVSSGFYQGGSVGVWIDFNDDGILDTAELAYSNYSSFPQIGNINLSRNLIYNKPLRCRIGVRGFFIVGGCKEHPDLQFIDISIIFVMGQKKPLTDFQILRTDCSPYTTFINQSIHNPVSVLWSFGDSTFSTDFSPNHFYSDTGTYVVSLKVCNINGCDSISKTVVVQSIEGPTPSLCTPSEFNFIYTQISQMSFDQRNYFFDSTFWTTNYLDLVCDTSYLLKVPIASLSQFKLNVVENYSFGYYLSIWIDFNNNGLLESNELVLNENFSTDFERELFFGNSAILNKKLRMRIMLNPYSFVNNSGEANPCPSSWQYSLDIPIVFLPSASVPIAKIMVDSLYSCSGNFLFKALPVNNPTSYFWDFGDGTTSTDSIVLKTYNNYGYYTVSLKTCNAFGCDSIIEYNLVRYDSLCIVPYCLPTIRNNTWRYIKSVAIDTFSRESQRERHAYFFDPRSHIKLKREKTYQLNIGTFELPTNTATWHRYSKVRVLIDFNGNGEFDFNEIVLNINDNGNQFFTSRFTVPQNTSAQLVRMRVELTGGNDLSFDLCRYTNNLGLKGEVEDYLVRFIDNNDPPSVSFHTNKRYLCAGDSVKFNSVINTSINSIDWNIDTVGFSNLVNPTVTFVDTGYFDVKLTASSLFGADSIEKQDFVHVRPSNQVPPRYWGNANVVETCCGFELKSLSLSNLYYQADSGFEKGYRDYTCYERAVLVSDSTYTLSISLDTTFIQSLAVYIDYNKDGVAYTQDEQIFFNDSVSGNVSIGLTVPQNVPIGSYRMRVMSSYAYMQALLPEYNLSLGNIIDFTIIKTSLSGTPNDLLLDASLPILVPNPAESLTALVLPKYWNNSTVVIRDMMGRIHRQFQSDGEIEQIINVSKFVPGLYIVSIVSQNGYTYSLKLIVNR